METKKKYRLEKTDIKDFYGNPLFRVVALRAFALIKKGETGGLIKSEKNLDQSGDAWVFGNARVSGNAGVFGNARVSGNAWVSGNAQVSGYAWVSGDARVFGNAQVFGDAWVYGNAQVFGDARVSGRFDLTVSINFELPRIAIDSKEKLQKLKTFLEKF